MALFFYDQHGGEVIGVLWKPTSFQPQPFKVCWLVITHVFPRVYMLFHVGMCVCTWHAPQVTTGHMRSTCVVCLSPLLLFLSTPTPPPPLPFIVSGCVFVTPQSTFLWFP